MKRPFNIFPSIGYRNSQFQIVSTVDNLRIDICDQDKVVKSIEAYSKYPTLLTSINSTGKLIAKCKLGDEIFQQELEIKEALRLGSSEFKKAFVFEDTEYSFFLMKDRLLLYDEKKKNLLTENHYSPTEIHKINETNYLFVTRIGSPTNGITNFGIYSTETFSIISELLNDYREIKILPETNKVWLYNIKSDNICCFGLVQDTNSHITELKRYDGFSDFYVDESSQSIFINYVEKLIISNINYLHHTIEIKKFPNNAIDKLGNIFNIESGRLICTNCFTDYYVEIQPSFEINLQPDNFIYIGNVLKSKIELTDLTEKVDEIKGELISLIPENENYYYHTLPENKIISESYTVHNIYPTINGIFIVKKEVKRGINEIAFRKHQDNWNTFAYSNESNVYTLFFCSSNKTEVLVEEAPSLAVSEHHNSMLLVNTQNRRILFSANNKFDLENESSIEFFTVNENSYFLVKSKDKYSFYKATNFEKPILEQIEILNPGLINEHQIIWYSGEQKYISQKNYLNAFDLKTCSKIFIDEQNVQHSLFKDSTDFKFHDKYALSSNQIVFNPISFEIKDAFIGTVESYSKKLNKIVSHGKNIIYLSVFDNQSRKYKLTEIPIDEHRYEESYLSPNGQFLVLQDESNKYFWYDIEKNETVKFISGNFLAFRDDGSFIVEEDGRRSVKIIDPKTFQDITPPNYHHYRFLSPDGKLYAQVASKIRYYHKLDGRELKDEEVFKFRQDLDEPSSYIQEKKKESAKIKVDKNRLQIFNSFKEKFKNLRIDDYTKITSCSVVKEEKYIEIGISGTRIVKELILPEDTQFYNYASFSYDNKVLGIVYRLGTGGGISFIKLKFNEKEKLLEILDTYLSRYPRYASWVCGFAKTGFFATYDSTPDTYIINVAENLFENKTSEIELKQNIYKSKNGVYNTYEKWNVIKEKNFLCFSPTGNYLALSEQGYEPLTLGGYGHQESNVVHIARTTNGQIMDSFAGHGDKIKYNKTKKVTFVAFSENERRIMTLSSDGVVIIREIKIGDDEQNE